MRSLMFHVPGSMFRVRVPVLVPVLVPGSEFVVRGSQHRGVAPGTVNPEPGTLNVNVNTNLEPGTRNAERLPS